MHDADARGCSPAVSALYMLLARAGEFEAASGAYACRARALLH